MNEPMIEVKNLSKQYRIQHAQRYLAMRDSLTHMLKAPLDMLKGKPRLMETKEDFWALDGVTFEVQEGEVVGIIGRNGAGKTTLLKVLSRITFPTMGEILLRGRVASLLEVGTGFHPELTGRENIYFNGAILGLKKWEIDRKFDEIVQFAEVERFIDTPVKRFSSGMSLRLAFGVAAHLEPEILMVDEVLAVGDALFQKKCIGKMSEVSKQGRTVIFVSHNMEAIERLCSRVILLHQGRIIEEGQPTKVIHDYLVRGVEESGEKVWHDLREAPGNDIVRMHAVRIKNDRGEVCSKFDVHDPFELEMEYWVLQEGHSLNSCFYLYNEKGQEILLTLDNLDSPWTDTKRPVGHYTVKCRMPADFFNNGQIAIQAAVVTHPHPVHVSLEDVLRVDITDSMAARGVRGNFTREWPAAAVRPRLHWKVSRRDLADDVAGNAKELKR